MADRKFNVTFSNDEYAQTTMDYNSSFSTEVYMYYASSTVMWDTFETPYGWDKWAVIGLVMAIIGTVANLVLLVSLLKTKEKKTSFTIIVGATAVSDILNFALYLVYDWAYDTLNFDVLSMSRFTCKAVYALWKSMFYMDSFLVIDLTIERLISAYFPRLIKLFSRRSTGMVAVGCSVVAAFIFNVHYVVQLDLYLYQFPYDNATYYVCTSNEVEYFDFIQLDVYFVSFLGAFLPSMVIIIGNVFLIKALCKSAKISASTGEPYLSQDKRDKFVYVLLIGAMYILTFIPDALLANNVIPFEQLYFDIYMIMWLLYHSLKCFIYILNKRISRKVFKSLN